MNTSEAAFVAVLKTLKANKVMVDTRQDGIYIRLAGTESKGECFTLEWGKVFSFGEKSNTAKHAERELHILSKSATDPENRPIIEPFSKELIALADKFGKSGQSGGSAPMTATAIAHAVKTLLFREPICPILGIDEEWVDVTEMNGGKTLYQNNRCSGVFKRENGECTYVDAIIWKPVDGSSCIHGSAWLPDRSAQLRSVQKIKSFPFKPKTFYIDVIEEEIAKDDWERTIKSFYQLQKVFKYYDKWE
jgi:hypothetical protein